MRRAFSIFRLGILLAVLPACVLPAAGALHVVSGTVTDAGSGELITGAAVTVAELPGRGAVSDAYGFYSLTLPEGDYTLCCSFVGYEPAEMSCPLHGNRTCSFALANAPNAIEAVEVTTRGTNSGVKQPLAGAAALPVSELARIPVLFGERDLLKSIQLLPGVKSESDGGSGFQVRGGTSSQNLVMLDEAPVTNAGHLMGFFSTFNSEAIRDATLYKGTLPVQFGGRVSSALDVRMREGNNRQFHLSGGIGLISARLNLEGPVQQGKSSFFLAGRRTYADAFLAFSDKFNGSKLNFYDLNAKFNHAFSERDRLFFSGYLGRDNLRMKNLLSMGWGNQMAGLRWYHQLDSRLVSNLSLSFSRYRSETEQQRLYNGTDYATSVTEWHLREEMLYYASDRHRLRFGAESSLHRVVTGEVSLKDESGVYFRDSELRRGWENALWAGDEWRPAEGLTLTFGLRLSLFTVLGGSTFYDLSDDGEILSSREPGRWSGVKNYFSAEPRLSVNWEFTDRQSLRAGYGRTSQNLHSVSSSSMSSPFDRYTLSTDNIRPERADQVSLGWFARPGGQRFEFSVEGYYRHVDRTLDYRDAATYGDALELETLLLGGRGRSYGAEFSISKVEGAWTGWISYTLSRTENRIDGINGGRWYAASGDRTHDLAVVLMWNVSPRWQLSASWVYSSGKPVTAPVARYYINGEWIPYYGSRNNYRAPASHRLDVGAVYRLKRHRRWEHELAFGIYNLYNRYNPYLLIFDPEGDNPTQAEQFSLFGIVPSFSYNFKF